MATASSTPTFSHKQHLRLLEPSQAESAIRDIFSNVSAADVRQQAGKTDENAGEMLPAAISSVIQMIGAVHRDDVFLDIGADLGNVAAQFAIQTIATPMLGNRETTGGEYHGDKAGKWPKTSEDVVFSTMSVKFNKALDNKGKDMFLSYPAQHEKKVSYGSSYENPISANVGNVYAKLPPAGVDHAYTKRLPAASRRSTQRLHSPVLRKVSTHGFKTDDKSVNE
ncbi:hypothetical protein PInf_008681 [Phytophthora infestans]|nr:hypothetical protein PInf_008681 [Phytophthora infestans]